MAKKKVIVKDPIKGFYVNLWSGEKGGTGKTFGSGMDAQRHIDRGTDFWLLDIDQGNMGTGKRYSDHLYHRVARLTEVEDRLSAANAIFEAGIERPTVVNCRASSNGRLLKWIENKYIPQVAKKYGVKIRYLFVSDLEMDSLNMFQPTAEMFAQHIPIIFVANLGRNSTGLEYFESEGFQGLLEQYKVPVVKVRPFDVEYKRIMEGHNPKKEILNWGQARDYPEIGVLGQAEIQAYLEDFYGQLDGAERFADLEFANRGVPGATTAHP